MNVREFEFLGDIADLIENSAGSAPGARSRQVLLTTAKALRELGMPPTFGQPRMDVVLRPAANRVVVVRVLDGDLVNSPCCNSRTVLFSQDRDFVACKCSTCPKTWPLFQNAKERMTRFWIVRCPGCGKRMEESQYAFHCHRCGESIRLVDLLVRP